MKKALALLMALATACTLGIGAYAAEAEAEYEGYAIQTAIEWGNNSTEGNPTLNLQSGQIVLGYSVASNARAAGTAIVLLPDTFLKAGNEFSYQLFKVVGDHTNVAPNNVNLEPITESDLGSTGRLRIRTAKGSSNVVSAKVEKKGSGNAARYFFKIETKATYGTKVNDLEYVISATGTTGLVEANVMLQTGYRSILDSDVDDFDEGGLIMITEERPVITAKQFQTLAKNGNFKPIEITNEEEDWRYIGRVSGMSSSNFLTTYDVIPDIVNNYPDNDYKFVTFNAGITFPTNGELRLNVDDFDVPGSQLFAYLYRDGELTPITTTYDNVTSELVFRTNYLGAFLITSTELDDIDLGEPENPDENGNEPGTNPPTGASRAVNAVVALGLVSLATAGAVSRKRK